jgi:hypothetical protein
MTGISYRGGLDSLNSSPYIRIRKYTPVVGIRRRHSELGGTASSLLLGTGKEERGMSNKPPHVFRTKWSQFDDIMHIEENGTEWWSAREMDRPGFVGQLVQRNSRHSD